MKILKPRMLKQGIWFDRLVYLFKVAIKPAKYINPFIESYYKTFDIEMSTFDRALRKNNNKFLLRFNGIVFVVYLNV